MCGFTGFFQASAYSKNAGESTIEAMAATIRHRGPDDGGIWLDADAGIGLGHRRLSIVDLSPMGHQPMVSASGRWIIVFNGEIYNHGDLRKALADAQGQINWRGHSDTETLLACIEAWGLEATVKRSVGMFALAVWDRSERRLYLTRDRLGEKPLYYGWAGNTLLFGSELKALAAHPDWKGEVDRDVLSLYFRFCYVPAPYSIYKNVWKLPAGCWMVISQDDLSRRMLPQPRPYWSLQEVAAQGCKQPFLGDESAALAELERLASQSIALQRMSDVPLGAFLSGGVDSSTVVALMQAQSNIPVRTFTIGFDEADFNEAQHAKLVAQHLGTDHTELYLSAKEAQAVIPNLPFVYDEPFGDPSQIPTLLVAQLARRHVTVSLSGDAGDELFGGYNRYFMARKLQRLMLVFPHALRSTLALAMRTCPTHLWDTVFQPLWRVLPRLQINQIGDKLHKVAEVISQPNEESIYLRLVSHWKDPASLVLGSQEPATLLHEVLPNAVYGDTFEQRMMVADAVTYLPDDILAKVDRAAMAVSLETRVPFLDHRLVEFAFALPLSLKIRNGKGKYLLRQLLYKYVPEALIDRPKMGFGVPIGTWLRGELRDWAGDLLDESRLRREGFLNPAIVRRAWDQHQRGEQNWQYYLWDVLMFQMWLAQQRV